MEWSAGREHLTVAVKPGCWASTVCIIRTGRDNPGSDNSGIGEVPLRGDDMTKNPLVIVWTGVGIQVLCVWLGGGLSLLAIPGMAISGWGLFLYQSSKGRSKYYIFGGAAAAVIPLLGPVLGLLLKPSEPGAASKPFSYGSWGFVLIAISIIWAICPAYMAQGLAFGSLLAALLSFAAWGARRAGRLKLATGLFLSSFGACAGGFGLGVVVSHPPLTHKSWEADCRTDLSSIRTALAYYRNDKGAYPSSLEQLSRENYISGIPKAKTPPYHPDSAAVVFGGVANDAGGWLYNNDPSDAGFGTLLINCTHQDFKGAVWSSF